MSFRNLICLVSVIVIWGCGGGSSSTDSVNDAFLANKAVETSPWASELLSVPSDTKKVEIGDEINQMIHESLLYYSKNNKYSKINSNINTTLILESGTIKLEGTTDDATQTDPRPIDLTAEIKFTFDGVKGNKCSLHGVLYYIAKSDYTSDDILVSNISLHGGCSYKDNEGVYNINIQAEMNLTLINGNASLDYTYIINDATFTGTKNNN
jgi:hypothetical protein